MRDAGISYAGDDGRVFISARGLLVDRDSPLRSEPPERWELAAEEETSFRNPFAKRSSRVARWLLLHHDEPLSAGAIAKAVDLNPAAVSRLVRTLEDDAYVREFDPDAAGRRRDVRLDRPRALLDAWLPWWQRRRIRHVVVPVDRAGEVVDHLEASGLRRSEAPHDRMGHANVQTTMQYLHYVPRPQDAALVGEAFEIDARPSPFELNDAGQGRLP
jgi:hypothetical protein